MWVVFVVSVGLNHSVEFFIYAMIGMAVMFGISKIDYKKIVSRRWLNCILLFAGMMIFKYFGSKGQLGAMVILAGILTAVAYMKGHTSKELQNLRAVFAGVLTGINIAAIGMIIRGNWANIEVFFTREGKRAYIYEVVEMFLSNAELFGRSATEFELWQKLPRYQDACILTTYIAEYGWIVGMLTVVLLVTIFCKIILDLRTMNIIGRMIGMSCIVILSMELIVVIAQNLLWIPFTAYDAFLPFFSQRVGSLWISYGLLGIIMSVYRFEER